MRALGTVAGVRERAQRVAARIGAAVKRTALAVVGDGNLWEQEHRHGALVGRDSFGNTYYENRRYLTNRERWVMYADKDNYSPKEVPPDWHAWLHRISDVAPSSANAAAVYKHPVYEQPWDSGKEAEVRPSRHSIRRFTCQRAISRTRKGAETSASCADGGHLQLAAETCI